MRIGIDISQIQYKGTGVQRYTQGLLNAILDNDQDNEWVFFFSSLRQSLSEELREKIIKKGHILKSYKFPTTFLSFLWNDIHKLQIERFTGRLDWFITSDWTEPPSASAKKATVVHDLVCFRYPETVASKILMTQQKRLAHVVKEAHIVFADSKATQADLWKYLNLSKNRVKVIYPGVDTTPVSKQDVKNTLVKYGLKQPFILTVGKIEPRKNLRRLIEAYLKLDKYQAQLVIVGQQGWDRLDVNNKQVKFLGYVTDTELFCLYSLCQFFVYPSIWEGFGYPVVEAMRFGTAVATSNTSSLKEVAEGAAYFFDPQNIESIRRALVNMSTDAKLRQKLQKLALKKSKEFTWKKYFLEMLKSLTKAS